MAQDSTDTTTLDRPAELWSIHQAAEFLGMSDDTARPLLEACAIRFSKRTVRYDPRDVWSLALSRKGTVSPEPALDPEERPERPATTKPFSPSGGVVRRSTTKKTDDADDADSDEEEAA